MRRLQRYRILLVMSGCFFVLQLNAQNAPNLFFKGALKEKRATTHRNLVRNSINGNLSKPLTDSTAEYWIDAFNAIQLTNYKSPWVDNRIQDAVSSGLNNVAFRKSLLELLYARYPGYREEVRKIILTEQHPVIFAIAGEYLLKNDSGFVDQLIFLTESRLKENPTRPEFEQLLYRLKNQSVSTPSLSPLFSKELFPGKVVLLSFHRKNRDYPGMVLVRDTAGEFVKGNLGLIFNIPQLGRSINNLPGYIKNGNTPQGLFRMYGFGVSTSGFIGPTVNIQMSMPFEFPAKHFLGDSTIADSILTLEAYKKLLPASLREYYPLHQSWYAGKAGRNEIIAHGTTVNPAYYAGQPYYPLTPTLGCLSTIEIWNAETGLRDRSDQQELVNAILKAGGAYGYAIVIEIDDQEKPVGLQDIEDYLRALSHF